jgi:hypothetical protein
MMGRSHLVEFRKVGGNVQLVARNERHFAQPKTPEARGVADAFSESLLTWAPIASQPHPERKSVLVEASSLLFADIPGAYAFLDRTYRQPYSFDSRNSSLGTLRTGPDAVAIQVNAHYAVSRLVQPPAAFAPGATVPSVPSTLPDPRSLFLGFQYNFARLPDEPMRPRLADPRVGHFTASRFDYSSDVKLTPYVSYVQRWRLEKKDPAAELSLPKQPIVFWLDRNIPLRYRDTVSAGSPANAAFNEAASRRLPAICTCAQAQDSERSGSSASGSAGGSISSTGSGRWCSVRSRTPSCLRTTIRQSQGRSLPAASALAGVKTQGKSGRSNSMAGK